MKCKDCKDSIRRYLDKPTGLWLHDLKIHGGHAVCNDQCYVNPVSSRMCTLGTKGCTVEGDQGHGC